MRRETSGRKQKTSWRKKQYDLLMNLIRKGGERWWISFLPHKHFTGSPGPATQFVEPVRNESVGHKSVGPTVQEILGISRQGTQMWGSFSMWGPLDI